MKNGLIVGGIILGLMSLTACFGSDKKSSSSVSSTTPPEIVVTAEDVTAPNLTQVSNVVTPARTFTPRYTFSSDEAGTIYYSGNCSSAVVNAEEGNNVITFNRLDNGRYSDCTLAVEDSAGNRSDLLDVNTFTIEWATQPLNDTGITYCSDYAYGTGGSTNHDKTLDCDAVNATLLVDGTDSDNDPVPAGQDALQGRDATQPLASDGHAGFNFIKLDASGTALVDQTKAWVAAGTEANYTQWSCVKDAVTGLIWEVKTATGLHGKDHKYTWYNSTNANDSGDHGVQDTGVGTAGTYENSSDTQTGSDDCANTSRCDTQKYAADVNASNSGAGLCGSTSWSLPTLEELYGLVVLNRTISAAPAIDTNYFPNTPRTNSHWTSSSVAESAYGQRNAWSLTFYSAFALYTEKHNAEYVRLVNRSR